MGNETWYRGEATCGAASKPGGGALHDIGEGVYFTSDKEVAKQYADTRAAKLGSKESSRAYRVDMDMSKMRILDLTKNPKWNNYLSRKQTATHTTRDLIKLANENYSRFFEAFMKEQKLSLRNYDAVIGQEFVRGGKQLCVLLRNGRQTSLHTEIRSKFSLIYSGGKEVSIKQHATSKFQLPPDSMRILQPNNRMRRAAGSKGAVFLLGLALGGLAQWLGNIAIERRIRKEVETTHAKYINTVFAKGQGVLLIICLQEWERPNDIGMRVRNFLSLYIQGGVSQQQALHAWTSTPKLLQGPPKGWRVVTQYVWMASPSIAMSDTHKRPTLTHRGPTTDGRQVGPLGYC